MIPPLTPVTRPPWLPSSQNLPMLQMVSHYWTHLAAGEHEQDTPMDPSPGMHATFHTFPAPGSVNISSNIEM